MFPGLVTASITLSWFQDHCQMSPLQYYVGGMTSRGGHTREEVEVVRKMLQAPMSLNKESLQILEQVLSDPSTPADVANLIQEEINRNCSKVRRLINLL
jgi:hypothetical protein